MLRCIGSMAERAERAALAIDDPPQRQRAGGKARAGKVDAVVERAEATRNGYIEATVAIIESAVLIAL